jgi:prepilin-type N-terminal cleavage/methylation domain-containing protein
MNPRKAERGFSLVEVLLAIAIGAILMTMMFSSLDTAIRTRQSVSDLSTPYAIGPAVLDALEADLRNAHFYDLKENDGFWGVDADLNGKEADGLSFITDSLCQIGEPELKSNVAVGREADRERRSPVTEVQYVCRRSVKYPTALELWRREDFYVDESPHDGGIYRLIYDRVFDFKLEYVRRNSKPSGRQGGAEKSADQMRQDGWNAIEESGLPRAVIATVSLYARESETAAAQRDEPQVFVFRRWIPLPQVHESSDSEADVATWDGRVREKSAQGGAGARNRNAGGKGGAAGGKGGGGRGAGQSVDLGGGAQGGAAGGFQDAIRNRGNRGSPHTSGLDGLFRPR